MADINSNRSFKEAYDAALAVGLSPREAFESATRWSPQSRKTSRRPAVQYALGPKRSEKPSSNISDLVADAAASVDPSYRTVVFSGQEPRKPFNWMSRAQKNNYRKYVAEGYSPEQAERMANAHSSKGRHPLGLAVDARFEDGEGNAIRDQDILDEIIFSFTQATDGNIGRGGPGYMGYGRTHFDTAPPSRYAPANSWGNDKDPGYQLQQQQARGLHDYGITTAAGVPTPTPRGGNQLMTSHPPDAMGINPMQPTMDAYAQYGDTRTASTGTDSGMPGSMPPIPSPRPTNTGNPVLEGNQQFADWQANVIPPIPTPRPEVIASQLIQDAVKSSEHERARRSTQGATPTHTNGDTRQDLIARADKGSEEFFPPVPMPPVAQFNPFQGLNAFGMNTASNSHQFLNALLKGGAGLY
ncbi:hypothetical protein AAFN47_18775 [Hoeflea sp. CAU 1731]